LQREAKRELARRELARRHLSNFGAFVYPGYIESWHTRLLCEALEHVERGDIRFLIVEMPPRHSKSVHVSQLFPAWAVGRDPDTPIIVSSYSGDLATDHGRETRNIIDGDEYRLLFNTTIAPDSKAKSKWNTNGKGAYNAAGVGGSITGKGAKFFIVDDPFKDRKEADSLLIRDDRYRWLKSVARTRLTPDGALIVMHTRWHDDDLIGRLVAEDGAVSYFDWLNGARAKWVRLTLKAIAESDEPYRRNGEALWPGRYNLDEQNRVFKPQWFKSKPYEEIRDQNPVAYLTVDTKSTAKAEAGTDYIGLCLNFVDQHNNWHLMAERRKMSAKDLIDLLFTWHINYALVKIGIEKTAFTEGLAPYLDEEMRRRNHYLPIVELKHGGTKKEIRIEGLQPRYERGAVFHLTQYGRNTCSQLEEELLRFPKAVNDDCSDATAYQDQVVQYRDESEEELRIR